jgi:hypothetical protein
MPDQSLLLLLDEVRDKTLQVLHAVDPRHARWTILWHAGHAYILAEWLGQRNRFQGKLTNPG